jgi:predicted GTPase
MLIAEKKYTVAEFITLDELDENFYYELIHGEILKKSSPTPQHQRILLKVVIWQNGDYDLLTYAIEEGKIESKVLAGLSLSAQELFNE